jgi:polysaccharide biosynthesis/export protein
MRNGRTAVMDADETTPVEPGDVIDVKNDLVPALPHDEAGASRLALPSHKMQETNTAERNSLISR